MAAGGGYLLVRRALKPVEQITRKAEQITQHNLSERLPVAHTGDELERLSHSLNRMIARLDDAFQNSKRFVADASHELRTPLTILRGELENLNEDAQLNPEVRNRLGSLLEEVERLSKIVEQLFALSRLDAGEAQTEWTRFDLAELAKTTAEQMSLLAEDKGIAISCNADRKVPVEGDRARLKQVVVNLLDNAIKYTPEQGAIQLRCHHRQRPCRAGSGGQRHGHSAGRAASCLRAVLPRGPDAFRRFGQRGAGIVHREIHLHGARRGSGSAKHHRQRQPVPRQTAVVSATAMFPDRFMKFKLFNRLPAASDSS